MARHVPENKDPEPETRHAKIATASAVAKTMPFLSLRRLRKAFRLFGPLKTPGPDEIHPIMVQKSPKEVLEYLCLLFKASIAIGYTPKQWRESTMIFIPKIGKADYKDPGSFRPITLTSFLFKALERVVLWHLNATHFKDKPMINSQFAFLRGRSTEAALSRTIDKIESAIHRNRQAMAVFLDIKGAFDNVNHEAALKAMRTRGIDEQLIQWYGQYLTQRVVSATLTGVTMTKKITRGTPQGGVLSPVIWNIVFESLLKRMGKAVFSTGFADDGCGVATGKNSEKN